MQALSLNRAVGLERGGGPLSAPRDNARVASDQRLLRQGGATSERFTRGQRRGPAPSPVRSFWKRRRPCACRAGSGKIGGCVCTALPLFSALRRAGRPLERSRMSGESAPVARLLRTFRWAFAKSADATAMRAYNDFAALEVYGGLMLGTWPLLYSPIIPTRNRAANCRIDGLGDESGRADALLPACKHATGTLPYALPAQSASSALRFGARISGRRIYFLARSCRPQGRSEKSQWCSSRCALLLRRWVSVMQVVDRVMDTCRFTCP